MPFGGRFDEGFTGHLDEIIISLKPSIFNSSGQPDGGSLLSTGQDAAKTRIYVCQFDQNLARRTALRVSDLNQSMSQKEAMLSQIDNHNAGVLPDHEFYGMPAEFCNQREAYSKFIISNKRDLIH